MNTELAVIKPEDYGLDAEKTKSIEQAFAPKISEREALQSIYETLITKELSVEVSAEAREVRLKLVKVGTGIIAVHKTEKAFTVATGKFMDAWKNKELLPVEQMKEKLFEIENYAVRLEEDRVNKLEAERKEALEPFQVNTEFLDLKSMSDEQFKNLLSDSEITCKYKARVKKEEEENAAIAERERIAAEAKAKKEQEEAARKEREAEKTIASRRELYYNLGFAYETGLDSFCYGGIVIPFNRTEWLSMSEEEFATKFENDSKLYHTEVKKEESAEKERLAKEEKERKAQEEKAEKARLAHVEKLEQEKADRLKAEKEKEEAQARADKLQAEKDKAAKIETDRLAEEKALLLAPEKEQLIAFLKKFDNIKFPEVKTAEAKAILDIFSNTMVEAVKTANENLGTL